MSTRNIPSNSPEPAPILAFAGSGRQDSLNRRALDLAVHALERAGARRVEVVDLRALELPLFDQDLEAASGLPPGAARLRTLIDGAAGLVVASPEYNASLAPLLKNALDWASRPDGGADTRSPFADKPALLLSASPGALGGIRALPHLQQVLSGLGAVVLPQMTAVGSAHTALAPGAEDARAVSMIDAGARALLRHLASRDAAGLAAAA